MITTKCYVITWELVWTCFQNPQSKLCLGSTGFIYTYSLVKGNVDYHANLISTSTWTGSCDVS